MANAYEVRLHASAEASFNALPLFVAGDGVAHIQADFGPTQTQRKSHRKDRTGTRSPSLALVHGNKPPVSASFSRTIAPGTTTTMDTHEILGNAMALSTSTYTPTLNPTDTFGLQLADASATYADYLAGCVVESWGVEWGAEEPTETFGITAARRGNMASTTLQTSVNDSETTFIFSDPERFVNCYGAVVLVDEEEVVLSNTVSDWTYAASTVTIANCVRGVTNVAHTAPTATVTPQVLASTTAGVPIGEQEVSLTYNSIAYTDTEGSITFNTGRTLREMESGNMFSAGVVNNRMEVTGSFSGIMDPGTDMDLPGHALLNETGALVLVIGTTATKIMTITIAVAELEMSQPWPDDDPLRFEATFIGYGSSGTDDISVAMS